MEAQAEDHPPYHPPYSRLPCHDLSPDVHQTLAGAGANLSCTYIVARCQQQPRRDLREGPLRNATRLQTRREGRQQTKRAVISGGATRWQRSRETLAQRPAAAALPPHPRPARSSCCPATPPRAPPSSERGSSARCRRRRRCRPRRPRRRLLRWQRRFLPGGGGTQLRRRRRRRQAPASCRCRCAVCGRRPARTPA